MNDKFYVYLLINPITEQPFYVGKGCGDRWKVHQKEAHQPLVHQSNPMKCNVIREIEQVGEEVVCAIHHTVNEQKAYELEEKLITYYGRLILHNGILTNILPGGLTGSLSKPVTVFDSKTGKYIGSYQSRTIAASSLNVRISSISLCLSGKQKTANGFIFRDGTKVMGVSPYSRNTSVDVYIIKNKLEKVGTFSSIKAAANFLDVNPTLVHNSLFGKQRTIHSKYVIEKCGNILRSLTNTYIISMNENGHEICYYISLTDASSHMQIDRSGILRAIRLNKTAGGFKWKRYERVVTT